MNIFKIWIATSKSSESEVFYSKNSTPYKGYLITARREGII
jgi:hypothetical protein